MPYIVAGAGGYYHLHHLQRHDNRVRVEVPYRMEDTGTILEKYSDDRYGFLRVEISSDTIKGTYYGVTYQHESSHAGTRQIDTFDVDWRDHRITRH